VNESRDPGYNDCQEMWDGFTKVCTLNEPVPARRQNSDHHSGIYGFPILPQETTKRRLKKMETLGVIESVSPMANCACKYACKPCGLV